MSVMNLIPEADYKDACDAIREKDGSSGLIKSGEMGAKIRAIPSGGGGECEAMLDGIITREITEVRNDRVTSIGNIVFSHWSDLISADFNAATYIGERAFQNCINLEKISFPSVEFIVRYSFMNCFALTTADFPAANTIGNSAFQDCSVLTTADFPMAVTIGDSSFKSCIALTSANFPMAVTIGDSAFDSCSALATLDLPAVTSIKGYAFWGCSALTTLRLSGPAICKASGDPKINQTCKIYVPASLIEQYKVATNWSLYASQFVAIEGV